MCLDFKTGTYEDEDPDESSDEEDEESSSTFLFLVIIFNFLIELLYALFHHWSFQSKLYAVLDFIPRPCPSSLLFIWRQSVMPAYFFPRPLPSDHPIFIISFVAYSDYTFLWLIPELLRIRYLYFSAITQQ